VIRVGKAGAVDSGDPAGRRLTLKTTCVSRTDANHIVLADTAPATISEAHVHTGDGHGIGVRFGNNPNVKHNRLVDVQISQADKGIYSKAGSFMAFNLGGGFSNYGVYIDTNAEPIILEQLNFEGNLVEFHTKA